MRTIAITILIICLALTTMVFVTQRLSRERAVFSRESELEEVMPSAVAKIFALDNRGLYSDSVFFKAYMFYGGKILRKETLRDADWDWFKRSMEVSTDLDPYFLDAYYMGAINLAWQANRVADANILLEKGMRARTWDWNFPFYLGFNYFYFFKDNKRAAYYLMEASNRPGGSVGLVPTLAARLEHEGGETESAVAFLEDVLNKTVDETTRYIFGMRLAALKRVLYLEQATKIFQMKFRRLPRNLNELVNAKIIQVIPDDIYGGKFYITERGEIKTTSNFFMPHK